MAYFPGTGWNALAAGLQGAGDMFINMYKMKEAERQQKLADEEAATRLGLAKSSNELAQKTYEESVRRNQEQALDDRARLQILQRDELRKRAQMLPGQRMPSEFMQDMQKAGMGAGELGVVQPEITEMGVKKALTEADYPAGLPANAIPGVEFQQPQEGGWFFKGDLLTPEQRIAQQGVQLDIRRLNQGDTKMLEDIRQFNEELGLRARAIGIDYMNAVRAGNELAARKAAEEWKQTVEWPYQRNLLEAQANWYTNRPTGAGSQKPWPTAGQRPVPAHNRAGAAPTAGPDINRRLPEP